MGGVCQGLPELREEKAHILENVMKGKKTATKISKTQVRVDRGDGTSHKGPGFCEGEPRVKGVICKLVYMNKK